MLASRRTTRINDAAGDSDFVAGLQKMEQFVEVHAGRRAGVEGCVPSITFTDHFHQLAQADTARMAGNKVDDVVSVDGNGVSHG